MNLIGGYHQFFNLDFIKDESSQFSSTPHRLRLFSEDIVDSFFGYGGIKFEYLDASFV